MYMITPTPEMLLKISSVPRSEMFACPWFRSNRCQLKPVVKIFALSSMIRIVDGCSQMVPLIVPHNTKRLS